MYDDDNDDVMKNKKLDSPETTSLDISPNEIIPKQQGKQGGLRDCHKEA